MAINYTQAFNAGEISRKMDGRDDLEIYKTGCRDLDNFFVLPQGGVERRAGTEFIRKTGPESGTPTGDNPVRMIEFDFSSDVFYVIELGLDYANVHYTDSSGDDLIVGVTDTNSVISYTQAELRTIQFNRRYDTLILTCPTKETLVFKRTQINPTPAFSIEEIEYIYPPTMEENITSTTITASNPIQNNNPNIYAGSTTTLTPNAEIFYPDHVGSYWAINHIRSATGKEVTATETSSSASGSTDWLDVSFSNWEFETGGNWKGAVVIDRRINGGTEQTYVSIGDTSTGVQRNFKYASTTAEVANTEIKVTYALSQVTGGGEFSCSISATQNYHKGVVKITAVDTTATPFRTATAEIVSMIQGGNRDANGNVQAPTATTYWSEGSFSDFRGFSPASEFFENRLWLAGSKDEPADIFGSQFGDIFNFDPGDTTQLLSTDAIKRTIDSPEEPKWLEGKRYLFLGTSGTAVSIRSADKDSLITQNNITTLVENAYGSAALQAEVANDVVVYVQRDKLKIRELVFDQSQDTFIGNDLNLISEDITKPGIVEMFVQKEPNQLIWCIKSDGTACAMTYERGQQVRGWAQINTDGKFYSAAAIHNEGEDVIWACIERTTDEDTPTTSYCIEKFHLKKDLDWYVDSGKQVKSAGEKTGTFINDISNTNDFAKINITAHGYVNGDVVKVKSSAYSHLNDNNYEVEYIDADNFNLKLIGTSIKIPIQEFIVSGVTYDGGSANGGYKVDTGDGYKTTASTVYRSTDAGAKKTFTPKNNVNYLAWTYFHEDNFLDSEREYSVTPGGDFPWDANWGTNPTTSQMTFYGGSTTSITVEQVANKVTGLDHLEGKTVQVLVDNNYVADVEVTNGVATVDQYGAKVLAGLPYVSTLRPMPIEPSLSNRLSQGRVKAVTKVIVRFFKTKGASVGEAGNQLTTFSVLDTSDSLGGALDVKTEQKRFFISSDYDKEKLLEVTQDLPYPMTVLSIASQVNAEGI